MDHFLNYCAVKYFEKNLFVFCILINVEQGVIGKEAVVDTDFLF